jgi:hypothetical protein
MSSIILPFSKAYRFIVLITGRGQRSRSFDANDASFRSQIQNCFETPTSGPDGETQITNFQWKWNNRRRRTNADARLRRYQIRGRQTVDIDSRCDGRCFVAVLRFS